MKKWVLFLGLGSSLLALSGCLFPFNHVAESPTGELAVILDQEGNYNPFPVGGAVWLLGQQGELVRSVLELGETEAAGGLVWSPSGTEMLVTILELDEDFFFPHRWRIVRLPLAGEPEVIRQAEFPLSSPRYDQTGSAVFYLASPGETPELHRLDLSSGEDRVLASDVLSFLPVDTELWLVRPQGRIEDAKGESVASFHCGEEDCRIFLFLWPQLFLDISPGGDFLALVVADQPGLTSPHVDPLTSLYLLDIVQSSAQRIATPAVSPVFSPDGERLAFVAGSPGREQQVFIYELESSQVTGLPGSEGAFWVRWTQGGLLIAVEEEEGCFASGAGTGPAGSRCSPGSPADPAGPGQAHSTTHRVRPGGRMGASPSSASGGHRPKAPRLPSVTQLRGSLGSLAQGDNPGRKGGNRTKGGQLAPPGAGFSP